MRLWRRKIESAPRHESCVATERQRHPASVTERGQTTTSGGYDAGSGEAVEALGE